MAGAAAKRDWAQIIRARLAGSTPRHEVSEWRVPGLFEPIDQSQQRWFPQDPVPAAVLMPLVERRELTVLFTQRDTLDLAYVRGLLGAVDEAEDRAGLLPRFEQLLNEPPGSY